MQFDKISIGNVSENDPADAILLESRPTNGGTPAADSDTLFMMTRSSSPAVGAILGKLTLSEKIRLLGGQANTEPDRDGDVFGIPRAGLPALKFADGPVGVHWWTKASTCYPALIGLAASFDEETARLFGEAIGTDCRAFGVHVLLAPGVNLYRSPLCGRNFEYLGEDPELSGALAAAYIRGVQSKGVAATVKHFAANNQEYDRHFTSSDVDERTLREVCLRPFERAVKEGRVAAIMTGYNPVNQVHASENRHLIHDILRGDWGFDGLVMSDWTSVYSTAQSLLAGLDLEMPWARHLTEEKILPLLETGVLAEEVINECLRSRLRLMERFGWLDPNHRQQDPSLPARNPATEEAALEVARRGIVLLKNEDGFLPRPPADVRRITVLGHHAGQPIICGGGSAHCPPHAQTTLLEALRAVYGGGVRVDHHEGIDPWREKQAVAAGSYRAPTGESGLRAEYFNNADFLGAPAVARVDERPGFNWIEKAPAPEITADFFSVRWTGQMEMTEAGEYDFYLAPSDGLATLWIDGQIVDANVFDSRRYTRHIGAGAHEIRLEFRQNRRGWVTCHFGYESAARTRVDYDAGLRAAAESDLVIVAAGFVAPTEGEGHDRSFALDPRIDRLILDAAAANANTCVVLYAGGAVDVAPWIGRVKALLCLWYPGQNGTVAAAEILAGLTNPSGKLPFTWEKQLADRGSFTCYRDDDGDRRVAYADGVFTGYRWFDRHFIAPRYPFGHGLSYTTFAYENLRLDRNGLGADDSLVVSFDVVNTGQRAGAEIALLFLGEDAPALPRPRRELKAFQRVALDPGERRGVRLTLPPRAFAHWSPDREAWRINPGTYTISIGSSATHFPLSAIVQQTR
jgi:beta-glucosidase